jgi:hypothetical protein
MTQTTRSDFNETWLSEMPYGSGDFATFDTLAYNIKDRVNSGSKVQPITDNLYKIIGIHVSYYWYGDELGNDIIIGTEIHPKSQGLVVSTTGKNPKYKGSPPYSTDLYNAILNDTNRSIRLLSDNQLSDEGFNIWKRLFQQGHSISVYDNENPGKSFTTFNSMQDMDQYFNKHDKNFKRYQYVLSEQGEVLAETRSMFNTRRYRELAGLDLED